MKVLKLVLENKSWQKLKPSVTKGIFITPACWWEEEEGETTEKSSEGLVGAVRNMLACKASGTLSTWRGTQSGQKLWTNLAIFKLSFECYLLKFPLSYIRALNEMWELTLCDHNLIQMTDEFGTDELQTERNPSTTIYTGMREEREAYQNEKCKLCLLMMAHSRNFRFFNHLNIWEPSSNFVSDCDTCL